MGGIYKSAKIGWYHHKHDERYFCITGAEVIKKLTLVVLGLLHLLKAGLSNNQDKHLPQMLPRCDVLRGTNRRINGHHHYGSNQQCHQ